MELGEAPKIIFFYKKIQEDHQTSCTCFYLILVILNLFNRLYPLSVVTERILCCVFFFLFSFLQIFRNLIWFQHYFHLSYLLKMVNPYTLMFSQTFRHVCSFSRLFFKFPDFCPMSSILLQFLVVKLQPENRRQLRYFDFNCSNIQPIDDNILITNCDDRKMDDKP